MLLISMSDQKVLWHSEQFVPKEFSTSPISIKQSDPGVGYLSG